MKRRINRVTTFRLALAVAVCLKFSTVWVQAQSTAETSEGKKLERQMASDIQAKTGRLSRPESPTAFNPFTQMESEIEPVKLRS
jgi:hypothetical protein